MSIATLADLRLVLDAEQRSTFFKSGLNLAGTNPRFGIILDQWRSPGEPTSGSTSSVGNAGAILTKSSPGCINFRSAGSGNNIYLSGVSSNAIWDARSQSQHNVVATGMLHIWDRIWYNDGLASNTTARRSWTPPALTRYTTGEGLSIWYIQFGSGSGAGTVTYTLEYTNQSGTATSVAYTWNHGADSFIANVAQIVAVPLALGDSGVRAVTAITQNATIASGSYGFAIQKYIGAYPIQIVSAYPVQDTNIFCGYPIIHNDAYLCLGLQLGSPVKAAAFVSTTSPTINGDLFFIEG